MNVRVLKINEVLFEGKADAVSVPAVSGNMQILKGHKPLIATLQPGTISIDGPESQSIEIEHGYLETTGDQVTVLL